MLSRRNFAQPYNIIDPDVPCPQCGYSLAGLRADEPQCPECGQVLAPADRLTAQQFPPLSQVAREWMRWPLWTGLALIMFAIVATVGVIAAMLAIVVGAVFLGTCLRVAFDLLAEAFAPLEIRHGSRRREQLAQLDVVGVFLGGWMVTVFIISVLFFSIARGLF